MSIQGHDPGDENDVVQRIEEGSVISPYSLNEEAIKALEEAYFCRCAQPLTDPSTSGKTCFACGKLYHAK